MNIPHVETIARASYGAATYDLLLFVPEPDTMKFVTSAGLHRFLPRWINMNTWQVDKERQEQEVWEIVRSSYLPPGRFLERYAQEKGMEKSGSIPDLNYELVKEIISISPQGKVNPLVYKLSTAHVNRRVGMDYIKNIYDHDLQTISDQNQRKYYTFLHEQVLRTLQRFVDDQSVLEDVLQKEGIAADLSEIDIVIFGRIGADGKPISAPPFL